MKQQAFEAQYQPLWQQLEQQVAGGKKKSTSTIPNPAAASPTPSIALPDTITLPELYRQTCHHLALAKHRRYSPHLIARLNRLVLDGHRRLYQHNTRFRYQWLRFVVMDFPQALRSNHRFIWVAAAAFLGPGLIMWLACFFNEEMIYSIMSSAQVNEFESLYNPEARVLGRPRESDTDMMMFGFYIKNNIGISFQTFATGILFGLGSLFYLVFNGIMIGGVAGHIAQVGYLDTFYSFVIGHGAFELTAIIYSGAAGLRLGYALIAPGRYRRATALRLAARDAIKIVYGAILMLVIAAFIEAFWSSSAAVSANVKYAVGALFWALVLGYSLFAGRRLANTDQASLAATSETQPRQTISGPTPR